MKLTTNQVLQLDIPTGITPLSFLIAAETDARNGDTEPSNVAHRTVAVFLSNDAAPFGITTFNNVTLEENKLVIADAGFTPAVPAKPNVNGDVNASGDPLFNSGDLNLIDNGNALGLGGWLNGDHKYERALAGAPRTLA